MSKFWLPLFLIVTVKTSGQNSFATYEKLIADTPQESVMIKVDSLIHLEVSKDSIVAAISIIHDISLRSSRKKNYSRSVKYALWEKDLYEQHGIFNRKYVNVLYNLGYFYYYNFEYNQALQYYELTIEKDTFNYLVGDSYFQLGRVYNKMGNYDKSISYYLRRIKSLQESNNGSRLVSAYINLAGVYRNVNTEKALEKAVKILSDAEEISKTHPISLSTYLNLQNALGNLYVTKTHYDFDKARYYRMNSLTLGTQYKDSVTISIASNNLAHLYNIEKRDSAFYYIEQGLKFENLTDTKARLHDNLAEFHIRKGKLNEALNDIHISLELVTNSTIEDVPTNFQINQSYQLDYALYCLKKKAEIYLRRYERDGDQRDLKRSLQNIERAEYVVDLLLNGTSEESTQMIWRREASQVYLYGTYAAHLLTDMEKAFYFMEKNKALLLSEGVLKNTEFTNLPKNISEEEIWLQKEIYRLENLSFKQDDNLVLKDSLFDAKLAHEKYVDSLRIEYPKYFARKINVEQIPLQEMQKGLSTEDAVVSFIWNDFDTERELIIGLIATHNHQTIFEVINAKKVREVLREYRRLISQPFETQSNRESYQKVAFELYKMIFANQQVRDIIKGKNLMIIPDGDLQNIPFEPLLTKDYSNEYLLFNGDINYSYSYSFLEHNEKVNRNATKPFIGYSPVQFSSLSLPDLTKTKSELLAIQSEMGGEVKLQDAATKQGFLETSSDSRIIHLATHADARGNPWIAFADEKLELHELYTYKNNADLVTLSACNTSLGDVAKGEGVLSLARGFFYSGSKSVLSSLWEVNDGSTATIMNGFYKNLNEGQTKSEAINNAKRDYLSNHSLSEQSPYYWSSFVLIGDAGSIDTSSNFYLYLNGVGVLFLVIVILNIRKKRVLSKK